MIFLGTYPVTLDLFIVNIVLSILKYKIIFERSITVDIEIYECKFTSEKIGNHSLCISITQGKGNTHILL